MAILYFRVLLSGSGISLLLTDSADGERPAIGFYTTRVVRAAQQKLACEAAMEMVLSEWRPGGAYAPQNRGDVPKLVIESVAELGFFSGLLRRKPSGYTFYQED